MTWKDKEAIPHTAEDVTGRERMTWNVLCSWGGHLVYIIAGFVMPRMIDRHVGQVSLGIWDFSWSLVSYFGLAQIGIGSSVNRHVAMYRASGKTDELRKAVSSVSFVQMIGSVIVVMVTVAAVWALPTFFANRLGGETETARWVVALLGASLAVQMAFDTYRGVITGCHRWDIHNGINSLSYAITVIIMLASLSMGGGLRSLAFVNLGIVVVTELGRAFIARRVCPELRIKREYVEREKIREMFLFGSKTVIARLPQLVLGQGTSILVASHLGPAALAVFSRPNGLVRNAQVFLNKYAFVLTPTAGSLQGCGKDSELRRLVFQASRFGVALAFPMVCVFIVYGDMILRVWMGPRYENGVLIVILAAGYFLPMTQQPVMTILTGLNQHGRIGIVSLAVSIAGIAAGAFVFGKIGWTLPRAALLIAFPMAVGNGVAVLLYACRRLGIPVLDYLHKAWLAPLLCGIPFLVCLVAFRIFFRENPLVAIASGCATGALVLALLYWRFLLTNSMRENVTGFVKGRFRTGQEGAKTETGSNPR